MSALPEMSSTKDRWELHRALLRTIYLIENKTLKEVREIMAKSHNFEAPEWEYETKLREWGFTKKLKKTDWPSIDRHLSKRKLEGRESEVLHHGIPIPAKKVRKETLRNRDAFAADSGVEALSLRLPNGVVIRTPPASPAVCFKVLERTTLSTSTNDAMNETRIRTPEFPDYSLVGLSKSSERDAEGQFYNLRARSGNTPESSSRTTPSHSIEPFPNQYSHSEFFNQALANQEFDMDFDAFTLFQSSESFQTFDRMSAELEASVTGQMDIFLRSDFHTTPVSETNTTFLSNCGRSYSVVLHNVPWFRFQRVTETIGSLSFNSFAENAFHSIKPSSDTSLSSSGLTQDNLALDERRKVLYGLIRSTPTSNDIDLVPKLTSMLQGLVPERVEGEISNKLQRLLNPSINCSILQVIEFALYFLSNNRLAENQTDEFVKWIIQQQSKELLRSLFKLKTPTVHAFSTKVLESIARAGNANTLQLLINSGIKATSLAAGGGGRLLQLAIYHNQMDVARLLLESGVDVQPPLKCYPFDLPPLHLKADTDIVGRLLKAGAKIDIIAENRTALSEAVEEEQLDCVRLLLEAGADVDASQIGHQSVLDWSYLENKDLYQILLSSSRKAQTSLTTSGVLCAANRSSRALSTYLDSGGRISDPHHRQTLESALCKAAKQGNLDVIDRLLKLGVDPNVETLEKMDHPLIWAVWANNIDLASVLLEAGADINTPDLLAEAAEDKDSFEILNFLIEQGADVETFGGLALGEAMINKNFAAVKLLLTSGANINDPCCGGRSKTPLQYAAGQGFLKMVKYLVKAGADINAPPSRCGGLPALQEAARSGNIKLVKFLLKSGADINPQPNGIYGKTVLEASADSICRKLPTENAEIFELLLKEGAHINGPRRRRWCRQWNSALTILIARSAENKLIQLALSAGADVNQSGSGKEARTPIQAAAEVGNLNIVKLLLDKGAEINAPPSVNYGRTALQAACCNENPNLELVQFLLGQGAEVNAPAGINGGLTALQGAAIQGHIKIALMLLDAGAEVNADQAEIEGRTALDGAAEYGRLDMVQLLLNAGAKSEPGETEFDTAIKLAKENDHFAVAELLRASNGDFEKISLDG